MKTNASRRACSAGTPAMDAPKLVNIALLLVASTSLAATGSQALSSSSQGQKVASQQRIVAQPMALNTNSRIADVLEHPAFAGFARLLLPWDGHSYDGEMPLADIASLLPYHSNVMPQVVVEALNRMIDDRNQGKPVFFDFYTEAQKQSEPSKRYAGLFFFRGKPGAPFAIIAPGGGFSYVGSVHEGFPYAVEINKAGYNAFVVKYRAGFGREVATQDMAAAISYIIDNAGNLGVGSRGYSVWGSSAGARMAASIGSHGIAAFGGKAVPRPSAVVMAYTAHADYAVNEPPTFVAVGEHDGIAPPSIMESRIAALRKADTPVEYRKYPNLGHGFGTGAGTSAEGWVTEATLFWQRFIQKR